jgi:hypothetical protein
MVVFVFLLAVMRFVQRVDVVREGKGVRIRMGPVHL